jgi:hypothetical protein
MDSQMGNTIYGLSTKLSTEQVPELLFKPAAGRVIPSDPPIRSGNPILPIHRLITNRRKYGF